MSIFKCWIPEDEAEPVDGTPSCTNNHIIKGSESHCQAAEWYVEFQGYEPVDDPIYVNVRSETGELKCIRVSAEVQVTYSSKEDELIEEEED